MAAAHLFVAVVRQSLGGIGVAYHHRPQEHHQVGLLAAAGLALEQIAKKRHITQAGHLLLVARELVLQQATQYHHGSIFHQHIRFDRAFVGGGAVGGVGGGGQHAGHLLEDGQLDRAVLADLGLHFEGQAHILALNGLEGVDRARAGAGVGELPGHKRYVLSDHDLGFFVVQRQQVGRGEHIAAARLFQKTRQKAQHVDAIGLGGSTQVKTA